MRGRHIRGIITWALVAILCFSALGAASMPGCLDGIAAAKGSKTAPDKVTLNHSGTVKLSVGETLQLVATLAPENATSKLTWSTSNSKVATVSKKGLVTARKAGKAKITVATANKKKASVTIAVTKTTAPSSVVLDQTGTVKLGVGKQLSLKATLLPAGAQSALTWSTSRKKVATVDQNGLVTAHAAGTAKITVATSNQKKASVTIKVIKIVEPTAVSIVEEGPAEMRVKSTLQLHATLTPSNATSELTWTSSKPKIATVDDEGLVTSKARGATEITVATANGKQATITVKVVKRLTPASVAIDQEGPLDMNVGDEIALSATVLPEGATASLTWESSDSAVATVGSGGTVRAVALGAATIAVKTANGLRDEIKVRVSDPTMPENLTISGADVVAVGASTQWTATLAPETARSEIIWESNNAAIAAVDQNGLVTGLAAGKATISATAVKGGAADAKEITVTAEPIPEIAITSLIADKTSAHSGETVTWTAAASGGDGHLLYAFTLYRGAEEVAARAHEASPSFSYTPTVSGAYSAKVSVRDGSGKSAELSGGAVNILASPIKIDSFTADKATAETGDAIAWTVAASGGEGALSYAFEIYNGADKIAERGYAAEATISYTATAEGSYTAKALVKDSTGACVEQASAATAVSAGLRFAITDGVASVIGYEGSRTALIVPAAVENGLPVRALGEAAFANKGELVSVALPEGLTSIGKEAFSGCGNLGELSIPESVTDIGGEAFASCVKLTAIALPKGVTAIGDGTFRDCAKLATVHLPNGIQTIGKQAFQGCTSLSRITVA